MFAVRRSPRGFLLALSCRGSPRDLLGMTHTENQKNHKLVGVGHAHPRRLLCLRELCVTHSLPSEPLFPDRERRPRVWRYAPPHGPFWKRATELERRDRTVKNATR